MSDHYLQEIADSLGWLRIQVLGLSTILAGLFLVIATRIGPRK